MRPKSSTDFCNSVIGAQEELEGQRSDSEGEGGGEGKQLQRLLKETGEGDDDEEEEEEDEDEEVGRPFIWTPILILTLPL